VHTNRQERAKPPQNARGHREVMVVDDDPAIAELVAAALMAHGMTVVARGSAQDAWEAFCEHGPFDAVLIDRLLPGEDGGHLADRLCAAGQRPERVVIMSGFHDRPAAYALLPKPFSLASLVATVDDVTTCG
jgi:two-component system OmpR family response regulator